MAKEDLSKLGFAEKQAKRPKAEPGAGQGRKKAQEGFISGTRSSR